jgi:hypothetical protein
MHSLSARHLSLLVAEDVGVTSVENGHGGASEELTAGGTELDVVAREVVDGGLGQHAVVLELRLAERRSVASNDDELGLAGSEALEGRLVTKSDLSGLHNKRQLGVDAVGILLALLDGGHFD